MHKSTTRTVARTALAGCIVSALAVAALPSAAVAAEDAPKTPKNIIHLVGDGMGYNQVDAGSLFQSGVSAYQRTILPGGQSTVSPNQRNTQVYQDFPVNVGMSVYQYGNTYDSTQNWGGFRNPLANVPDSAATATTLASGIKTLNDVIGQDQNFNDVKTIAERAVELGKASGVVTSVPWSHATPASYLASENNRNSYAAISADMLASGANVLFGAGNPMYDGNGKLRSTPNYQYIGEQEWNNLIDGQTPFEVVQTKDEFAALAEGTDTPQQVVGFAQAGGSLQTDRSNLPANGVPFSAPRNENVPALKDMTSAALNVLNNASDEGFFLMVEGGAIDWASHSNNKASMVEEQVDFNKTVETVVNWVEENSSWDETLLVVTADHETGGPSGPGANPNWTPVTGAEGAATNLTWSTGGHANNLVPLFAKGAGSELIGAAATSTDPVRGAFTDNSTVGRVSMDLWAANDENGVPVTATVPDTTTAPGSLSMTVADGPVAFGEPTTEGDNFRFSGQLPTVSVTDSRNDAQAAGGGWTVSGQASDLLNGGSRLRAESLGWTPKVGAPRDGLMLGDAVSTKLAGGAGLTAPATLATASNDARGGTTEVSADIVLDAPKSTRSGQYTGSLTVSLFPVD